MVKITSDTLRYYDEIQLLNPDFINPSNNYRFYSEEQVKELLYIMELKDCGFNLDEIKRILKLNDKTKIKQIFTNKKMQLSNQRKKINLSIEKIESKLKFMEGKVMSKNKSIMIVDDAPFMRMMVNDILRKNGYENVIEATEGTDGVIKWEEHKPDLTFMDINMPGVGGIYALNRIKSV